MVFSARYSFQNPRPTDSNIIQATTRELNLEPKAKETVVAIRRISKSGFCSWRLKTAQAVT